MSLEQMAATIAAGMVACLAAPNVGASVGQVPDETAARNRQAIAELSVDIAERIRDEVQRRRPEPVYMRPPPTTMPGPGEPRS